MRNSLLQDEFISAKYLGCWFSLRLYLVSGDVLGFGRSVIEDSGLLMMKKKGKKSTSASAAEKSGHRGLVDDEIELR